MYKAERDVLDMRQIDERDTEKFSTLNNSETWSLS